MKLHCRSVLLVAMVGAAASAVVAPARAVDVTVAGRRMSARASQTEPARRSLKLIARDQAIAAPFPDPRAGSTLVISGGAAPGQCLVVLSLDPSKWRAIGDDGGQRGYRYVEDAPGADSLRIVLRPGALSVRARGAGVACDLAAAQRVPVSVVLRVAATRYCAAFGGAVAFNTAGRFFASHAPAPDACPKSDLTVADLNILHGISCPRSTRSCRLPERIDLLFQWIVKRGCPDVVTLQEVSGEAMPLITAQLNGGCPFAYHSAYMRTSLGIDDEMILSRYPIATVELQPLYRDFRTVLFGRIDHPIGPVDVFTSHLASAGDGALDLCVGDCPRECVRAGAATVRECQAVQLANVVATWHDAPTPAVVTGDFNESPGSFAYGQFGGRGWTDVYLAAGNPECDPATGIGCTSGRQDENLSDLESPASNEIERIDYIFLVPAPTDALCTATIDSSDDADGDGTGTRIFAGDPNPFAPTCGPAPAPICWPSDHEGVELDLNCS